MSLHIVRKQINRFLSTDQPEVMAIKGAWGVGKTYTWKKLLYEAKEANRIKLNSYSYVSLFGINSLETLKYSIFEQAIDVSLIGNTPSIESFKSNITNLFPPLGKRILFFLQGIPSVKNFSPVIESLSFLSIKKKIICFDDFERKSDRVSMKDILGLILVLKEHKNCKIVLIFNDEKMEGDTLEEYKKFREKVIDFEIEFKPTSQECVEIALSYENELGSIIREYVIQLGINNIRIIKKIECIANILYPILSNYEEEVLKKAIHTLCLYSLCFYGSDNSIPKYEYVKNIGYNLLGLSNKEESEEEKVWNAFLREYDYKYADEFDLRIGETVEKGYVNGELLKREAENLNQQIVASKSKASFTKAWDLFNYSFSDNQEETMHALSEGLRQSAKYISPIDLNAVVKLFRELGEDSQADELIDFYINVHKDNPDIFNLNDYYFSDKITDKKIRKRFEKISKITKEKRNIKDVLFEIAKRNNWGQEDEEILANATPDKFYYLFKNELGKHLPIYVDICLQFGRLVNATDRQKKIAQNARKALERIGGESPINKIRVRRFGIQIKD